MQVIPNFLRNSSDIIRQLLDYTDQFKPRVGKDKHESIIPGLSSRFKTLKDVDMKSSLIKTIFADADFDPLLKDTYSFIQIQMYEPGDYIVPHKDVYSITKLHLLNLTSSDVDGLICEDENHVLKKIYDQAGTYIDFPYDAFHWVDPVKYTRFSLVIGE